MYLLLYTGVPYAQDSLQDTNDPAQWELTT